jgi:archaellum component FlaC
MHAGKGAFYPDGLWNRPIATFVRMLMQEPLTPTPLAPGRPTAPVVVIPGVQGSPAITIPVPRTARDIEALKARRDELSNQLQSVDGRRSKLFSQLKSTGDPTAVKGLEDRLALLDSRQLQLESDLATTGQALSSPAAGLIAGTSAAPFGIGLGQSQIMTLSVLSILFIFFPLAVGLARGIWKRSSRPGPSPSAFAETAQRLERLEASVDAIAIEIERVSEGQRFVTKLLSEGQPAPMLGTGQRAPETVRGS